LDAERFIAFSLSILDNLMSNGAKGIFLGMSINRPTEQEVLLTPAEVAKMFRVDPKTVTRWAKAGKLTAIRTLGGHRRYRRSEVQALLGIDAKEARSV